MKIAVMIGGSGRTLNHFLNPPWPDDQILTDVTISLVIAHNDHVAGLKYARAANVPILISNDAETIWKRIRSEEIDLVCLAGWIKFLPIPDDFENKVINIHPSLIPAFCGKGMYGMNVHEAVIRSGVKYSGCTIHFVNNEYDAGPILLQKVVTVFDDDTPRTLANRIFCHELQLYTRAIRMFKDGRLKATRHEKNMDKPLENRVSELEQSVRALRNKMIASFVISAIASTLMTLVVVYYRQ